MKNSLNYKNHSFFIICLDFHGMEVSVFCVASSGKKLNFFNFSWFKSDNQLSSCSLRVKHTSFTLSANNFYCQIISSIIFVPEPNKYPVDNLLFVLSKSDANCLTSFTLRVLTCTQRIVFF